jgi:hypothetical protein
MLGIELKGGVRLPSASSRRDDRRNTRPAWAVGNAGVGAAAHLARWSNRRATRAGWHSRRIPEIFLGLEDPDDPSRTSPRLWRDTR